MTLKHFGIDPAKEVKLIAIGDERLMYDALKIGRVDASSSRRPFRCCSNETATLSLPTRLKS